MGKGGFVGRERELAVLQQAWENVQHNETRIISIEGDPGIGKTALVRRFLRECHPESLIWASGDEAETNLPWGVLTQIAHVLPIPGVVSPDGPWETRTDPVFVGQALARQLQDCKDLILVLDDAQWADRLSLATLRLAARRLLADPVLLIVIHQTPGPLDRIMHDNPAPTLDDGWRRLFDSDRGLRLPLSGLTAPDLVRLAVTQGHHGLSPGGAARLHTHTSGHPLHARHLLDELPLHAINYGHGPLPAPQTLTTTLRTHLSRCSPTTRTLLSAAAILGPKSTLTTLRTLMHPNATEDHSKEIPTNPPNREAEAPHPHSPSPNAPAQPGGEAPTNPPPHNSDIPAQPGGAAQTNPSPHDADTADQPGGKAHAIAIPGNAGTVAQPSREAHSNPPSPNADAVAQAGREAHVNPSSHYTDALDRSGGNAHTDPGNADYAAQPSRETHANPPSPNAGTPAQPGGRAHANPSSHYTDALDRSDGKAHADPGNAGTVAQAGREAHANPSPHAADAPAQPGGEAWSSPPPHNADGFGQSGGELTGFPRREADTFTRDNREERWLTPSTPGADEAWVFGRALEEAVGMRLLEEVPGAAGLEVGFPGAMVRGLVYHEVELGLRRELHRRAARRGGAGALWHRIAGADGPDEGLAGDVERAARERLAQGWLPLAAVLWRHAVELTPVGAARGPRLLGAVEALLVAGDIATSLEYQGEVAALAVGGVEAPGAGGIGRWAGYVFGYQLLLTGQVGEATVALRRALEAEERHPLEPADLAARIASQLTIIGVLTESYPQMIDDARTAVAGAKESWVAAFAWFARSIALAVVGRSAEALEALAGVDAPGAASGLDGMVARGMIRLWTDDPQGARSDLASAVDRATRGEPLRIGQALGFLGEAEYRLGALGEAVLHAELAVGDAEDNSRVWDYALLHGIACYPLAAQGEWARAEAHAEQASRWAREVATPANVLYAATAQAMLAQARDDPTWLLAAAEDAETIYPTQEPGTHLLGPLRAEALCRLGRLPEALQALREFQARLGPSSRRSVGMGVARVKAQIATASGRHQDALLECRTALQIARETGLRLEAARIELLTGKCQHTMGRRAAAERSLRAALDQFTAMGATAYMTQTLDAAHQAGMVLDTPPEALGALTAAERAVVTLATAGNSNREIAERLVLSVKTIEFHLTNVFRKLDIGTRDELRRLLPEPGWPREIPGVRPGSPRGGRDLR
ncbi:hypothetical protein Aph01nite_69470 [Acrocarpospora phusangensis]|uniref:HTH luxR-type domain-containing protein n=1 Tax=Acrocarpospora phusangensis TaxID=1070424 RepID=A0A919US09_9ACTN|nr:AAA family ATPase [Acrocarpospora phusangensis]GIH28637.1 hypothetical protein Aph01nite_69470 [Acrocarpospora phusangensis]